MGWCSTTMTHWLSSLFFFFLRQGGVGKWGEIKWGLVDNKETVLSQKSEFNWEVNVKRPDTWELSKTLHITWRLMNVGQFHPLRHLSQLFYCPSQAPCLPRQQDTMLNLGFSELGTVRSFQVTPREAETNLWYKIPQTSCMPQLEIRGPLSPLLLHWVWWELSLSYSLHLLYTLNYRKILMWVLQAGFSLCKWNILEQKKLSIKSGFQNCCLLWI